jgi:hypothetical protein
MIMTIESPVHLWHKEKERKTSTPSVDIVMIITILTYKYTITAGCQHSLPAVPTACIQMLV